MSGQRVLIVGGGIAGLALARMLARTGVRPEVIEREPAWRHAGTGIYLPGNATSALRALGLGAQVARRSVEIPRQRFCDHRGRLLCDVDVAALWGPVGPCLALHRAELHELLREATDDVPIRMGLVAHRIAHRDGIVSVECSDGTSGEYDLLVAADGINGAVRRLTFEPTAVPQPVGQVGWRFLAPRPPAVTTWSVMLGRRTAFLTIPIGDNHVYCYCDVLSARDPDSAEHAPAERLTRLFSEFADPAATLLDTLDPAAEIPQSRIEEITLDSWVRTTSCSSATPRTRHRPTWPRAQRWHSKTRSCSPTAYATSERSQTRSRHSRPDADPEPTGSAPRPTAATTPGTSRPP